MDVRTRTSAARASLTRLNCICAAMPYTPRMGETVVTQCPWCGEALEVWVERDGVGSLLQDCDVCCRPVVVPDALR